MVELQAEHLQALTDLFTEQDTLRGALEAAFVILAEDAKGRAQTELLAPVPNFYKAVQLAATSDVLGSAMSEVLTLLSESMRTTEGSTEGGQSAS